MELEFTPAATIEEVISRLDVIIAESIQSGNREGYFAALYRRVTVTVRDRIAEGYFDDNERMERLDVIFANRYLEAYFQWKHNQKCSECWQVSFRANSKWRPLVIQQLFVGMNAHIGLDLGIAAAEAQPENLESLKKDFNKINVILGELTNVVQDELAEIFPAMKLLDKWAGGTDEKLAGFAMEIARDAAWSSALKYNALSGDKRDQFVIERDKSVAAFGNKIVSPGWWINVLTVIFRLFERGSISKKIRILNQ